MQHNSTSHIITFIFSKI